MLDPLGDLQESEGMTRDKEDLIHSTSLKSRGQVEYKHRRVVDISEGGIAQTSSEEEHFEAPGRGPAFQKCVPPTLARGEHRSLAKFGAYR
jgi:hypothetical protein